MQKQTINFTFDKCGFSVIPIPNPTQYTQIDKQNTYKAVKICQNMVEQMAGGGFRELSQEACRTDVPSWGKAHPAKDPDW